MKKLLPIIGIILFLVAIIFIVNLFVSARKPTATIDNRTFYLYIAKTEEDKQIGLSKYDELPQDHGMLFMFETTWVIFSPIAKCKTLKIA